MPDLTVKLLPSTEPAKLGSFATTYLVNGTVAIDAGTLGFYGRAEDQARVRNVLVTHTHADHLATLPIFVENVYEEGPDCPTLWGSAAVLHSLRSDVFNDRIWPDLPRLVPKDKPFYRLAELHEEQPIQIDGLRITPVSVEHIVDTFGFIIEAENASVVIVSDTAPTDRIWELANRTPHLRAVFLEATFPESMQPLAQVSKHLTPTMFRDELAKLTVPAQHYAVHLKPKFQEQICQELQALQLAGMEVALPGKEYLW
jgi:ribonuclease BN (tRNA processing enzyme)